MSIQSKNQKTMLFEAIEFAARAHSGQYRKISNIPYIIHPLAVVRILIECGCSENLVVAGLLHDTVEDTSVTLKDIQQKFGEEVARLVEAASEPDKSESWNKRKQHTLDSLETAPIEVLLIVCADKLDNIRSIAEDYAKIGEKIWSNFNHTRKKQKWYFESLVEIFNQRADGEPGTTLFRMFQDEVNKIFADK